MKSHFWILLLTGIYPYQAQALIDSALETANNITNAAADLTSDVAHAVAEPVGDVTDVALDASVGTVDRLTRPSRFATREERVAMVEEKNQQIDK